MSIQTILYFVFLGIAIIYLCFSLIMLFKDKKILLKDKILFLVLSSLILGRNVWVIISGSLSAIKK